MVGLRISRCLSRESQGGGAEINGECTEWGECVRRSYVGSFRHGAPCHLPLGGRLLGGASILSLLFETDETECCERQCARVEGGYVLVIVEVEVIYEIELEEITEFCPRGKEFSTCNDCSVENIIQVGTVYAEFD